MDEAQVVRWLRAIGAGGITGGGAEWIKASCPLAEWTHRSGRDRRPSFGVRVQPGESRVHCLACHFAGTQTELVMTLADRGYRFDFARAMRLIVEAEEGTGVDDDLPGWDELRERREMVDYPEHMVRALEPAYCDGEVHPYLALREVPYEVAEHLDLRHDPLRFRIVFPVRDYQGALRGLHGRDIAADPEVPYLAYNVGTPPNDANNLRFTWLGEHLVDRERPVVMPESVFDLCRVLEAYDNVLSPMRSRITAEQLERVQWARRVVTLFDNDEAGDLARDRIQRALPGRGRVTHLRPPPGLKDAGEMRTWEVRELLTPVLDLA